MNWFDIAYLSLGNNRQQKAYTILKETDILSTLREYNPVLVGTIPLEIDIAGSDLDIICQVSDFPAFQKIITDNYASFPSFTSFFKEEAYIASFRYAEIQIEIYAENKPTTKQYGYRHMLIEYRILNIAGERFKQEIVKLKEQGYKTEPAFGRLLNLTHPYTDLLQLENLTDTQLSSVIRQNFSNN